MSNKSTIIDTACQFAWDYPVLQLSKNELRYCCRANPNPLTDSEIEMGKEVFTTNSRIIQIRKDLLSGIKTQACSSCWDIETNGGKSPRAGFDRFAVYVKKNLWKDIPISQVMAKLQSLSQQEIQDIVSINSPRMVEIMLGNTCDMKCVYCNHNYSSQWASERLKYNEIKINEVERQRDDVESKFESSWWEWFESKAAYEVNTINFIGGEPLLSGKFYDYIDRIIDFYEVNHTPQKSVTIGLVTNMNTPKKQFQKFLMSVERILSHNKFKIDFNVSMESTGNRAEFIRNGTDWATVSGNFEKFLDFIDTIDEPYHTQRIAVSMIPALNNLCISDFPNFLRYVVELQRNRVRCINIRQNQVSHPQWNNPYILPPEFSRYIDESIEVLQQLPVIPTKFIGPGRWDLYIEFLKTIKNGLMNPNKDTDKRIEFMEQIDILCSRRNQSFQETFPEMIEFYQECTRLRDVRNQRNTSSD